MKFKVGDKVMFLGPHSNDRNLRYGGLQSGDITTIMAINIDRMFPFIVRAATDCPRHKGFDGASFGCPGLRVIDLKEHHFKLIPRKRVVKCKLP